MLAVTLYSAEQVARVRALIRDQLDAHDAISASSEFDDQLFRNLVLLPDRCFVHRMRGAEGKDGDPLNEMRMICDSIVNNAGILTQDKSINYQPETSIPGLAIGDHIILDTTTFVRLTDGVFSEIQRRFPSAPA